MKKFKIDLKMKTKFETTNTDSYYMARALQLAHNGFYTASPNPRVGCVIVKDEAIVGEGWHAKAGAAHAEIVALEQSDVNMAGASVYLTLEPCVHHGRTPPCSKALIAADVARVVIAVQDPNPEIAGAGVAALQAAGIQTNIGVCEKQARELNIGFFTRMQQQRPWVRIKWGMSLDARVADSSGNDSWITSEEARRNVQFQRASCGALLTGADTVLADNPQLNVRLNSEELNIESEVSQPLRVIIDGALRTSPDARIYHLPGRAVVATCSKNVDKFANTEIEMWHFSQENGHVPLGQLLKRLSELEINEVQVEAGPTLSSAFIEQGLYDEILLYIAPCLLGGGVPLTKFFNTTSMEQREILKYHDIRKIGDDMRVFIRKKK